MPAILDAPGFELRRDLGGRAVALALVAFLLCVGPASVWADQALTELDRLKAMGDRATLSPEKAPMRKAPVRHTYQRPSRHAAPPAAMPRTTARNVRS